MNSTAIDITRQVAAQHQADIRRQVRDAALARQAARDSEAGPRASASGVRRTFAWRRWVPAG
ncbi:hypothetical protein [Nocardioides gansuensis]|uniref:hypothetical protein n=1 Tax=Nocardioides gansuensis TaxID=2138300 RepID=UPI000E30958B|nr:hypothetical protein [Nocardioides gansuensis]